MNIRCSYKRKYVHEVLVNCLLKLAQEKSVLRWTDRPAMTIAVNLGGKATKQTEMNFRCLVVSSLMLDIDYQTFVSSWLVPSVNVTLALTLHLQLNV